MFLELSNKCNIYNNIFYLTNKKINNLDKYLIYIILIFKIIFITKLSFIEITFCIISLILVEINFFKNNFKNFILIEKYNPEKFVYIIWLTYELIKFFANSIIFFIYIKNKKIISNWILFDYLILDFSKFNIKIWFQTYFIQYLIVIILIVLNIKRKKKINLKKQEIKIIKTFQKNLKIKIYFKIIHIIIFSLGLINFNFYSLILISIDLIFIYFKNKFNKYVYYKNIIFLIILISYLTLGIIFIFSPTELSLDVKNFLGINFYFNFINNLYPDKLLWLSIYLILMLILIEISISIVSKIKLYENCKNYYYLILNMHYESGLIDEINYNNSFYKSYFTKNIIKIFGFSKNPNLIKDYNCIQNMNFINLNIIKNILKLRINLFKIKINTFFIYLKRIINNNITYMIIFTINVIFLIEYQKNLLTLIILMMLFLLYFKIGNSFLIKIIYEILNIFLKLNFIIFFLSNIKNFDIKFQNDFINMLLGFEKKRIFEQYFIYINFFISIYILNKMIIIINSLNYKTLIINFEIEFIKNLFENKSFNPLNEVYLFLIKYIKIINIIWMFLPIIFLNSENLFSIINSILWLFCIMKRKIIIFKIYCFILFIYLMVVIIISFLIKINIINNDDLWEKIIGINLNYGNYSIKAKFFIILLLNFNYILFCFYKNEIFLFIKKNYDFIFEKNYSNKILSKLKKLKEKISVNFKVYFEILIIFSIIPKFNDNFLNLIQLLTITSFSIKYFYNISKYNMNIPISQWKILNIHINFNTIFLIVSILLEIIIYIYIHLFKFNWFREILLIIGGGDIHNGISLLLVELFFLRLLKKRISKNINFKEFVLKNNNKKWKYCEFIKMDLNLNKKILWYNIIRFNFLELKENIFIKLNILKPKKLIFFNYYFMICFYIIIIIFGFVNISLIYIFLIIVIFIFFFESNLKFFKFILKQNWIKISLESIEDFYKKNLTYKSLKKEKVKKNNFFSKFGLENNDKNIFKRAVNNLLIKERSKKNEKNNLHNKFDSLCNFMFPKYKKYLTIVYDIIIIYSFFIIILLNLKSILILFSENIKKYFHENNFLYEFIGLFNNLSFFNTKYIYFIILYLACIGLNFINYYFNNNTKEKKENYIEKKFVFENLEIDEINIFNIRNELKFLLKKEFNKLIDESIDLFENLNDWDKVEYYFGFKKLLGDYKMDSIKNIFYNKLDSQKNVYDYINKRKRNDNKSKIKKIKTIKEIKYKNNITLENRIKNYYINKKKIILSYFFLGFKNVLQILINELILLNFLENQSYISIIYLVFFLVMIFLNKSKKKYLIMILFNILTSIFEYFILCLNYERIIKIDGKEHKNMWEYILYYFNIQENNSNFIKNLFKSKVYHIQTIILLIIEIIVIFYYKWFIFIINMINYKFKDKYKFICFNLEKYFIDFKKYKSLSLKILNFIYVSIYIYIFEYCSLCLLFLINILGKRFSFVIRMIYIVLSFLLFFIFRNNFKRKLKSIKIFLYCLMIYNYVSILILFLLKYNFISHFQFEDYFGNNTFIFIMSVYYNLFLSFISHKNFEKIYERLYKKKIERDYILSILIRYL